MDDQLATLRRQIEEIVAATSVIDIHTHLYPPEFGSLLLWGIDEILTYHYLVAELFRSSPVKPEDFWAMDKRQQADLIWETLFVRNFPVSEACRGVVTILDALGLDPAARDLREAREFFASQKPQEHVERVLEAAGVSELVMTNSPFNETEARVWRGGGHSSPRFRAALRLDPILNEWQTTGEKLAASGFENSPAGARRFLDEWIGLMKPLYAAVSLSYKFQYPEESPRTRLIREAVLPACREHGLPLALMIGVAYQVNPALREGGDGVGRADIRSVERLCLENPDNRFLVTMLSRENQHELCVAARKFGNLMPFGCWWFLNNPSIVAEITSERLEMLGLSFIPQHSDARVLEQLIYKWRHSRRVITNALCASYRDTMWAGRRPARAEIERDVRRLFAGNFREWTAGVRS